MMAKQQHVKTCTHEYGIVSQQHAEQIYSRPLASHEKTVKLRMLFVQST